MARQASRLNGRSTMTQLVAPSATAPGVIHSDPAIDFALAQPLDRRRLQAYLALMMQEAQSIEQFRLLNWAKDTRQAIP